MPWTAHSAGRPRRGLVHECPHSAHTAPRRLAACAHKNVKQLPGHPHDTSPSLVWPRRPLALAALGHHLPVVQLLLDAHRDGTGGSWRAAEAAPPCPQCPELQQQIAQSDRRVRYLAA